MAHKNRPSFLATADYVCSITMWGEYMEYKLFKSAENSSPYSITCGVGGTIYYTENKGNHIGVIRSGKIERYPIPTPDAGASVIALQGDMAWFTMYNVDKIGAIGTDRVVREIELPAGSHPFGIAVGENDKIWFTCMGSHQIGCYDNGELVFFSIPTPNCYPSFITCADDGTLWFCENQGNRIGHVTANGTISEYELPHPNSAPVGIAPCGNGAVFVELMGNRVGHIDAFGEIAEYSIATSDAKPHAIALDSDNGYWISLWGANKFAHFSLDGSIVEYDIPAENAEPHGICTDSQGMVWAALERLGIACFDLK